MDCLESIVKLLAQKKEFYSSLRRWFRREARSLPWRETSDPYHVWVSEVMLQQTTVAAVMPFYMRFLAAFPSVFDLAAADELEVLRLWAGLGYYRRARMLHRAAQIIARDYNGKIPSDENELRRLPGVGRYTANAIACFAYNRRVPIIEANTRRVLVRLLGVATSNNVSEFTLWRCAERLLPVRSYREFNYALMELGSLVCTERAPRCHRCPIAKHCLSLAKSGCQVYVGGARARRQDLVHRRWRIWVFRTLDCPPLFLVCKFSENQWHAGLFGFPFQEVDSGDENSVEAGDRLCLFSRGSKIGDVRFSITRHRIEAEVFYVLVGQREEVTKTVFRCAGEFRWVNFAHLQELPLASPYRRILDIVYEYMRGEHEHAGKGAHR